MIAHRRARLLRVIHNLECIEAELRLVRSLGAFLLPVTALLGAGPITSARDSTVRKST
jgi:hypothetical protein